MPMLEAEHLQKTYRTNVREVTALRDVSFTLEEGETIGILGPSGSGKSTIGQIVTGLLPADRGVIRYQGELLRFPLRGQTRREIQILFQHPEISLNPKYCLMQGFRELYRRYQIHFDTGEFYDYLAAFGLYREHMERRPVQLSGGELQRTMIARIMLLRPRLIVLDEPTSMLDAISQAQVLRMLKDLQGERRVSYIYITHNRALAQFMCHRIYRLQDGILQDTKDC